MTGWALRSLVPKVQLPNAKAHQIGRAKKGRMAKPHPNPLYEPLLLLSHRTDFPIPPGNGEGALGRLTRELRCQGKKQLPWGVVELGHLFQGDTHSPQGPTPLLAQQNLTTRNRERRHDSKQRRKSSSLAKMPVLQ